MFNQIENNYIDSRSPSAVLDFSKLVLEHIENKIENREEIIIFALGLIDLLEMH